MKSKALILWTALVACGGETSGTDALESAPPFAGPSFALRIDGQAVDLEAPETTRFSYRTAGVPAQVVITASHPDDGGDVDSFASVSLNEPISRGTFDCTPNEKGEWVGKRAILSPGFAGFRPTLSDCTVTVTHASGDRFVGRFSVKAHPPETSSLAGKVSVAEGEFDVRVEKELEL